MHRKGSALLGVEIGRGSLPEITHQAMRAIDGQGPRLTFACANPHSLVVAQHDEVFLEALRETSLVVADGVGVRFAAALLGAEVGPRITGYCFFQSVLQALQARGQGRVFFFGSSEKALERIGRRFARDYPALTLCGSLSPPYRPWSDDENARMVGQINAARPDVLWVAMTAPKQEKWVHANLEALNVPVIGSVGAVFEFYAETTPRAPDWLCDLGFEWIYRLIREPRRMWRRTFVSGPRFVSAVLAERFR